MKTKESTEAPTIVDISCVPKDDKHLLKLTVSKNAVGIIYKTNLVLFTHGWWVTEAVAETVAGGLVKDVFLIKHWDNKNMNDASFSAIKTELIQLIKEETDFKDHLTGRYFQLKAQIKEHSGNVNLFNPPSLDCSVLDIKANNAVESMVLISGLLYLENIDIISLTVHSEGNFIRYSFLLKTSTGYKITEEDIPLLISKIQEIV
jgi:UTP:GlnB (protein PII) uridylyltransferase